MNEDWKLKAKCRNLPEKDLIYFFPPGEGDKIGRATSNRNWQYYKIAKENYCSHCPVSEECFQYGFETLTVPVGVWGGYSGNEIVKMKRRGRVRVK